MLYSKLNIEMKPKLYFIAVIILLLIFIVGGFYAMSKRKTYPSSGDFNFYEIHEINQNSFTSGTYNTEGYVVKIYTCPSYAFCIGPVILISENKSEDRVSSKNELSILVYDNPRQFNVGKKYTFSIEMLNRGSVEKPSYYAHLVGYDLAE